MEALVVLRSQVGLRLGSFWRERDLDPGGDFLTPTALVGRTIDGGQTWTRQLLGQGRFVAAGRVGQQVYAVNLETEQVVDCAPVFRSRVYCSSDEGRSWQPRGTVAGLVKSVVFPAGECGYALVNSGGPQPCRMVLQTADGGRTWSPTLPLLAQATRGVATPQGAVAFLLTSTRSPVYATQLAYFGGAQPVPRREALPGFRADNVSSDANGNLWFLADDSTGQVRLFKRDVATRRYSLVHRFETRRKGTLAEGVQVVNHEVFALTSEAGTHFNHYRFYHSADGGQQWQEEKLPVSARVAPYAVSPEGDMWLSGLGAELQVRQGK